MNIFEALKKIQDSHIAIRPFNNYEASNLVVHHDTGVNFKSNADEWPINKVEFSGQGNLNIKVLIPGQLHVTDSKIYACSEIRSVTIVKNGELKLQYLQLSKNKEDQSRLVAAGIKIKNNIVDLGQFALTERASLAISEIGEVAVNDFLRKLYASPKPANDHEPTEEEKLLALLGLKNGIYTKPVKTQETVEENDKVKISLKDLSSKTTKLAKHLKELKLSVKPVNLGQLIYDIKCLKIKGNYSFSHSLTNDITVTGTLHV